LLSAKEGALDASPLATKSAALDCLSLLLRLLHAKLLSKGIGHRIDNLRHVRVHIFLNLTAA